MIAQNEASTSQSEPFLDTETINYENTTEIDDEYPKNSLVSNNVKRSDESANPKSDVTNMLSQTVEDYVFIILNENDEDKLVEFLQSLPEDVLPSLLKEVASLNKDILKENDVYEALLKEDKHIQHALQIIETDEEPSDSSGSLLSFEGKCYFANKRLQTLEDDFKQEKSTKLNKCKDLKFQLNSLNLTLGDLKESQDYFNKNIRYGGKHPVTKKVVLQKVSKFFDDSIKSKIATANRYKIQIESDTAERYKILSQLKEQQKRLALLDYTKFQEAKSTLVKSRKTLNHLKEQLKKCKSQYSFISSKVMGVKKSLVREESVMKERQATISKKENMKSVMKSEKARNDEKLEDLKASMKKMQLDPRRQDLPEVTEYATVKRENEMLKKRIKKWKQKVDVAEQAKLMHLQKKSHHS